MQLSDSDLFLSTPSARRATLFGLRVRVSSTEFLSTPSARRATSLRRISGANRGFLSTPSARRATLHRLQGQRLLVDFYPRPPRGGRPRRPSSCITARFIFLSTPSARRATVLPFPDVPFSALFLSTPSARRATRADCRRPIPSTYFYPRPPRGGRRNHQPAETGVPSAISIHALREEGDM